MQVSPRPEIESLTEFDNLVSQTTSLRGWQVQGVDLSQRDRVLSALPVAGAIFMGCTFSPGTDEALASRGALVFPEMPEVPFDPYRGSLYLASELYEGITAGYQHTPDARIYAWLRGDRASISRTLAAAVHDNSIDDALLEWIKQRPVVGVMGGHSLRRGTPDYAEAAALGRRLAQAGLTVATGGGPGAMEAANLGARLCREDGAVHESVVEHIAAAPTFDDVDAWIQVALESLRGLTDSAGSLGIPTWHYGHEPPNPFASVIAKYFRNAVREDILLQVCNAGVIFLPGAAGTVQEIFQSACANFYSPDPVPMVLVGNQWRTQLPAWPLLKKLAADREMEPLIHLVDNTAQAVDIVAKR